MANWRTPVIPVERQFRFNSIVKESRTNAKVIRDRFAYNFKILRENIDCQSRLTGLFFHEVNLKRMQDLAYEENLLLNNTLLNLPYRAFSVLLLVENSMYGAARPILRQSFEQMIIAKQSELDPGFASRWQSQERIGVSEVMTRLTKRGKDVSTLTEFWATLNRVTHATREAMQPLLIPQSQKPQAVRPWFLGGHYGNQADENARLMNNLVVNSMFTLDLLHAISGMNFHLLVGHFGRKARRYFPGSYDPEDISKHERELKKRIRYLLGEYSDRIPFGGRRYFKRVVFQFRQDWGRQPQSHERLGFPNLELYHKCK